MPAAPLSRVELEDELAAQFEFAGIPCTGNLAKLTVSEAGIHAVVFGVVEGVEGLKAKLNVSPLGHGKRLVERSREVYTAGSDNAVLACAAEALVVAASPYRNRGRVSGGVKPLRPRLDVVSRCVLVRTVRITAAEADRIVADRQARSLVGGNDAGLIDNRTRDFPSAEDRLCEAGALGKEGQPVDVVDVEDLATVKRARALVVLQVEGVADPAEVVGGDVDFV